MATALITGAGAACAACGGHSARPAASAGDKTGAEQATGAPAAPVDSRLTIDLFALGRVLGTVAPCGCTTEPLGGMQYAFGYIESHSRPETRLVIEPGSLLFPDPSQGEAPTDDASWEQAQMRAQMLSGRLAELGEHAVSGVGPTDFTSPKDGVGALGRWSLPRVLANAPAIADKQDSGVVGHRIIPLGAPSPIKVGVTAAVDPRLGLDPDGPSMAPFGSIADPVTALEREVSSMKKAGADLTVVIAHGPAAFSAELAGKLAEAGAEVDLILVAMPIGLERAKVGRPPGRVGKTWIVEPGEKLQSLTHIKLEVDRATVPEKLPASDGWEQRTPASSRTRELKRLEEKLAKFKKDPSADPAYIARLEKERDELTAYIKSPPPSKEPVAITLEQVKITCHLEADEAGKKALHDYDAKVAEQNRKRFAGVKPPAPADGKPGYVGDEECSTCHEEAYEHWKTTRHAGAYKTLVDDNKQFDLSCVGCHVTGFREPGGSEVVENETLRNIQCEQCHGPGEQHAEEPEKFGKPNAITLQVNTDVCLGCHTPEHSDTFEFTAYLRDVLGAGHGEKSREKLGDGPTGRELRAAGFAKAGGACPKH